MVYSKTALSARDAQREEASLLTPAERLCAALELSDVCTRLNAAGVKALEARHAAGTAEKEQRTT